MQLCLNNTNRGKLYSQCGYFEDLRFVFLISLKHRYEMFEKNEITEFNKNIPFINKVICNLMNGMQSFIRAGTIENTAHIFTRLGCSLENRRLTRLSLLAN